LLVSAIEKVERLLWGIASVSIARLACRCFHQSSPKLLSRPVGFNKIPLWLPWVGGASFIFHSWVNVSEATPRGSLRGT
jgi:hypothetical protein